MIKTILTRKFVRYSKVYQNYVVKLLLSSKVQSKVQAFAKGFGILGAAVGALFLIYTMLRFR